MGVSGDGEMPVGSESGLDDEGGARERAAGSLRNRQGQANEAAPEGNEPRIAGAMRGRQGQGNEAALEGEAPRIAGPKPDFRVVQTEYDSRLGKTVYKDVGAMWRNVSKAGNEFYTMKIGKLKLLVFQNQK